MFNNFRSFVAVICLLVCMTAGALPTYYDKPNSNVQQLFKQGRGKYVLRYAHQFRDTLHIPHGCEVKFRGGKLTGPVVFDATKLSGNINLKGSSIRGNIINKTFDASWLCSMDGVTDDAPRINEIIAVCKNVFFPHGTYRLVSPYKRENFHIGITQHDVTLTGEEGTVFLTMERLGMVCVFTRPNDIANFPYGERWKCILGVDARHTVEGRQRFHRRGMYDRGFLGRRHLLEPLRRQP